jgi:hypothetical protein
MVLKLPNPCPARYVAVRHSALNNRMLFRARRYKAQALTPVSIQTSADNTTRKPIGSVPIPRKDAAHGACENSRYIRVSPGIRNRFVM